LKASNKITVAALKIINFDNPFRSLFRTSVIRVPYKNRILLNFALKHV